jgi:hypothetical protein
MGITSRIAYAVIITLWFSSGFLIMILDKLGKQSYTGEFLFFSFITILIALFIYSKYINRNLEEIGVIQLTQKGIKKSIAGIDSSYKLKDIDQIIIKKHIRAYLFSLNHDGTKTYLVTIISKNQTKEEFIISSQSIGKPSFNFYETMKKIQKISGEPVTILSK